MSTATLEATERKLHHYFGTLEDPRWEIVDPGGYEQIEFNCEDGNSFWITPGPVGTCGLDTNANSGVFEDGSFGENVSYFGFESEQEAFDFLCHHYDEKEKEQATN